MDAGFFRVSRSAGIWTGVGGEGGDERLEWKTRQGAQSRDTGARGGGL